MTNQSPNEKIKFSNVVVKVTRNHFWERKWRPADIHVASLILFVHMLSLFAPFTFTWDAFGVAFIGYLLTGLVGITLSYHRLLAHHSLKLPKWLEYTCVYFGVLALQETSDHIPTKTELVDLVSMFTLTWDAFGVAFIGYWLTGLVGITLSYHRLLAHHSLKHPKWLEHTCVYFGVLAAQRDPIFWVSIHRYHHQFVDSEKDAHSPINGFWFSHMGWLFDSEYIFEKYGERKNVEDLKRQWFYMFIKKTYKYHILGCGALLYAWGGFSYLVWGMGVRIVWVYHLTALVNSACHIWGNQAWNTGDLSKNNWWVAMLTFGEGWHNNHHAFEFSARHGLEWWQIDMSWYIIRFLEALGLATNVKVPTEAHKLKKSFDAYDNTLK